MNVLDRLDQRYDKSLGDVYAAIPRAHLRALLDVARAAQMRYQWSDGLADKDQKVWDALAPLLEDA